MSIDPEHCATCYALANSTVEVEAQQTGDHERRFVPNIAMPFEGEPVEFGSFGEARFHDLARHLFTSGVAHVRIDAEAVTITKTERASWAFIEPMLGQVLVEQLTLAAAQKHSS